MATLSDFEACIRAGNVAVFPADTVYGIACDPENRSAVAKLYALKGRAPDKPAAVMFFDVAWLPPLGPQTALAAHALLPGGVTLLVPNPNHYFRFACGPDPNTLGIRVPADSPLAGAQVPVLQTSANFAGGPDARTLDDVPAAVRAGAAYELDAGELPGTPSTVLDLRRYEEDGTWSILRAGAVSEATIADRIRC